MSIYREFLLRTADDWRALTAFIKANAKAMADKGEPLRLIVTSDEKKRTAEQNRFYWGVVIQCVTQQAWVDGRQFAAHVWHEHFARMYAAAEDMTLPDGEIITRRKSTTDMSVGEFAAYINQVQAHAAQTWGVIFE